ncbi:unnamed protein product [Lampetra fluviatilis]
MVLMMMMVMVMVKMVVMVVFMVVVLMGGGDRGVDGTSNDSGESPTQATGPQDSMASPLPNPLLAYLLLTLFLLTIRLTHAETFKKTDCQIERCMKEKKKCEEKLNKYLSEEEKCEGDAFNDVDMNCLLKFRTSLDQLTATSELKAFKISSKAQQCAYNKCFDNVKTCLHEHHTELAVNPASKRRFELDHCAYVAVDFPHECENIISIAGCADSIATCIEEHPDYTLIGEWREGESLVT